MNADRRYVAVAAIVGIFVLVQLGALALVEPFKSAGFQDVQNPSDPTNSLLYVGAILVATVVMLGAFRYGGDRVIRAVLVFSSGYLSFYVFAVLVPAAPLPGLAALAPAVALAALVTGALWVYPEWYVIDAAGVVMGAGAAGLFGINFGILPALVLLVVLAVYDAISVYGTEHMLTLAEGVMDLKVPVVLVVPLTLSYSFLDESPEASGSGDGDGDEEDPAVADGGEADATGSTSGSAPDGPDEPAADSIDDGDDTRDAFFIGLGDAVMPAVLIASAGFFAPVSVSSLVPGIALTLPALTAMIGTNLGLLALMYFVMQGRAHAGLPLLNGGAIGGYLVGAVAAGIPLVRALGLAPYI
ncbi:presenilin family intramembrane aspartyl protease PSH [Haloglomus litoreum]|uniref:presenilin family intramembrane aspartyl protease PSH n=1 Tax=Haloglomus litoreum TaxID=3034026 RepID=UPI0023E7AAEF|nr:presenilin family intramembrane aspartyl protease PSH [Haloglomus sp. DT116]